MSRTFKITLAGQDYTLHPFNLGELEQIAEITDKVEPGRRGFAILKLALRRADPSIADPSVIEATINEFRAAIDAVMEASGMNVGEAMPATAA